MTHSQHTPGPWGAAERGDYSDFDEQSRGIIGNDRRTAAERDRFKKINFELLEALQDLIGPALDMQPLGFGSVECRFCGRTYYKFLKGDPIPKDATECASDCPGHMARAAIAKAKGESK